MKLFLIIGIQLLLLISCSVKKEIAGKYVSHGFGNIQFNKDSTYYYEYGLLHRFERSSGKWLISNKNELLIFSDIKSTSLPLIVDNNEVEENLHGNIIALDINIINGEKLENYQCSIHINDSLYFIGRCDSVGSVKVNIPIKSIYFMLIKAPQLATTTALSPPLITDVYRPEVRLGNKIKIRINANESNFFYRSFNGEIFRIGKTSLQYFNRDNGKWKKLNRISDSIRIFTDFREVLK